jgi:lactate dehydrogenase-like 2-hydroxyacid dehydrogenase
VILTPHIGSHTIETRQAMEKMAVMNLLTYESLSDNNDLVKTREILTYIDKHTII